MNRVKRQPTEWTKILTRGLISRIYEELKNLTKSKPFKKMGK
jgi:hypothetical protein